MDLEELSLQCQAKVIRVLDRSFLKDADGKSERDDECLPFEVAIREILIPTLIFAHHNTMTDFFQQLFDFTLIQIEVILSSSSTRTAFFTRIPTPVFQQILISDELAMPEFSIWELAFNLACHNTNVLGSAVKAHFRLESNADHEDNFEADKAALLSDQQLKQLKVNLSPLLPAIRFSLIEVKQYSHIVDILYHFLPARRLAELQRFHAQPDKMRGLDLPRLKRKQETLLTTKHPEEDSKMVSDIINKLESWQQLKAWIFESDGIAGCHSAEDVKLDLLFRASEHQYLAEAFHEHCDIKGPTLVIVKSDDGHLFGGINFSSWESDRELSGTTSNFLFALADGIHRNISAAFSYSYKAGEIHATFNTPKRGPVFGLIQGGSSDLNISEKANTSYTYSKMPSCYDGIGSSDVALAGKDRFLIAEYEVFAISKIQ